MNFSPRARLTREPGERRQRAEARGGTREKWQTAREKLREREEELNRLTREVAEQPRQLPWVKVEKDYEFEHENGGGRA
jgi:predicted dithiol-disulfide oxidoreductase (DUF899 family)